MNSLMQKNNVRKNFQHLFRYIMNNRRNRTKFILAVILIIIFSCAYWFINNNENYYHKTIAKITSIKEKKETQRDGKTGIVEKIKKQQIKAVIINGKYKGKQVQLENTTSYSQVNDLNLKTKDQVFISFKLDNNKEITEAKIIDLKRDKYLFYVMILFIILILWVGGLKGFKSLTSVVINLAIFLAAIELFIYGYSLWTVAVIASILFIILSITIVSGINKKTLSAIIGTAAGTFMSMVIAIMVIKANDWHGIHFEEMEFLTHPPRTIFLVEILIGTLGAIMDIAISISSAIKEIYDKNAEVETRVLINSGKEIGKDIMGTMANTLVFAYISGLVPLILLLYKNGYSFSYIININLSLEIIRGLTGSIGIILSIPITIYISVLVLKNKKH